MHDAVSLNRNYADLHEHLDRLDKAGLLHRINEPVNKDTEIHPLVRWQFRGGIAEKDRKAFLFSNLVDSKRRRLENAVANPVPPRIVNEAPCHDIVLTGREIEGAGKGLEALPVPISTPGFDAAPFLTATCVITRDPKTGVQNVGTYRGHLKAPTRLGMMTFAALRAGGYEHWKACQALGQKMPVAIVVGCPPLVAFQGAQKLPLGVAEIGVAGGLAGGHLNVG